MIYLSHPQEFSARQNLTTQQKAGEQSAVMMSASTFYRPSREETGEYYLMNVVGDE